MQGVEKNDDGTYTVYFLGEAVCTVQTLREAQKTRLIFERATYEEDCDYDPDEEDEEEEDSEEEVSDDDDMPDEEEIVKVSRTRKR